MLTQRYDPKTQEPALMQFWQEQGVFQFDPQSGAPVFAIDTPPPTVSGHLHLGHVYSYSQTDFMARFFRMNGCNVFYPMGYDDNGLPTERLVEKRLKIRAGEMPRPAFIQKCLEVSAEAEKDYEALWKRLGLSVDWRYTYRTIDEFSRRTSQQSFIELAQKGLAYHREAPAIWCPECRTSIAQAELNDLERESEFVTLAFRLAEPPEGESPVLPIATTRPELLPACVAVFVHPADARYSALVGRQVQTPLFGQWVPVLADPAADPEKGSGAVVCCTFGDTTDVSWWYTHHLPLVQVIERDGRLNQAAGFLAGLSVMEARQQVKQALAEQGFLLERQPTAQSVRVHERCDTPVEYILLRQWFVRLLDFKADLLMLGERLNWHPAHMQARYQAWVENLNWDWCISRQRFYGVAFPLWYCAACGSVLLAEAQDLPVDPSAQSPKAPCPQCGGTSFQPETDVFDTWATSSLSPQIAGRWLEAGSDLYSKVFPFSLRPQAHEIIRTWAFYTIVKTFFHFGAPGTEVLPWRDVSISGWGLAGEGMGKISKSRGGGPLPPLEMIERYSADAVRYWAASTGPGKDSVISEDKIQTGASLVNKLWNVARFCERFLAGFQPPPGGAEFSPADRWILARLQRLVRRTSQLMQEYEYAAAKSELEAFFWTDLADNYLEMCKQRLYGAAGPSQEAARLALHTTLKTILLLFAPFLPYVTEAIYQGLFAGAAESIHRAAWPAPQPAYEDAQAEALGETLVEIATTARRYKSQHNLSLGAELPAMYLRAEPALAERLRQALPDLASITRVRAIDVQAAASGGLEILLPDGGPGIGPSGQNS